MFNLAVIPAVYLDMDGTIINFYGVPGWLEYRKRKIPHRMK